MRSETLPSTCYILSDELVYPFTLRVTGIKTNGNCSSCSAYSTFRATAKSVISVKWTCETLCTLTTTISLLPGGPVNLPSDSRILGFRVSSPRL